MAARKRNPPAAPFWKWAKGLSFYKMTVRDGGCFHSYSRGNVADTHFLKQYMNQNTDILRILHFLNFAEQFSSHEMCNTHTSKVCTWMYILLKNNIRENCFTQNVYIRQNSIQNRVYQEKGTRKHRWIFIRELSLLGITRLLFLLHLLSSQFASAVSHKSNIWYPGVNEVLPAYLSHSPPVCLLICKQYRDWHRLSASSSFTAGLPL